MSAWKYTGKGERVSYGVKPKDLSAEEFERLNPLDQRHVMQSDLYREVKRSAPASKPAGERKQEGGDS